MENLKFPIGHYTKPDVISKEVIASWILVIEQFPNRLKKITNDLSIESLNWVYRPEGWAIKQVVHHCADSHMNSFIRFKLALTEDCPTIKPYEEAKWAALVDGLDNDISASLNIIEGVHYRWVFLLKSLNEVQLNYQFEHPETKKIFCLDEVIGLYAWHCNHHFSHIEQALLNKGNF